MAVNVSLHPIVKIFADSQAACRVVARRIANLVTERASAGRSAVLGLATGYTSIGVYKELIRIHKQEGLEFSNVVTFNLDEYWPIEPTRMQSYNYWMKVNFFDHINISPENIHIPSGTVKEDEIECTAGNMRS